MDIWLDEWAKTDVLQQSATLIFKDDYKLLTITLLMGMNMIGVGGDLKDNCFRLEFLFEVIFYIFFS